MRHGRFRVPRTLLVPPASPLSLLQSALGVMHPITLIPRNRRRWTRFCALWLVELVLVWKYGATVAKQIGSPVLLTTLLWQQPASGILVAGTTHTLLFLMPSPHTLLQNPGSRFALATELWPMTHGGTILAQLLPLARRLSTKPQMVCLRWVLVLTQQQKWVFAIPVVCLELRTFSPLLIL